MPAPTAASLTYRVNPVTRAANLRVFIGRIRQDDPKAARTPEETDRRTLIIAKVDAEVSRTVGLTVRNVSHSYAYFTVASWQAAHGDRRKLSASTYARVAEQVGLAMAGNPAFTAADDRTKQRLSESMLLHGVSLEGFRNNTAGDPAETRALAQVARQGASRIGHGVDAMVLTDEGLAPR